MAQTTPKPGKTENEVERLKSLYSCNLLNDSQKETFDQITRLASIICEVPIALVTLIDEDRQWFKSAYGISGNGTPREHAFCSYAIHQNDVFLVPEIKRIY